MTTQIQKCLTFLIIHHWLFNIFNNVDIFPYELYREIRRYCCIGKLKDIFTFNYNEIQLLNMAKMAESSERYNDLIEIMTHFVKKTCQSFENKLTNQSNNVNLYSLQTRILLYSGYKNKYYQFRQQCRALRNKNDSMRYSTNIIENQTKFSIYNEYLEMIQNEIRELAESYLDIFENHIMCVINKYSNNMAKEEIIYYLKKSGDFCVNIYEQFNCSSLEFEFYCEKAKQYFMRGNDMADKYLCVTNTMLLQIKLSYSCYLYYGCGEYEKAYFISKTGFDNAMNELDSVSEDMYNDVVLIMQLLRDNAQIWRECEAD
eukprot:459513_1